VFFKAIRRYKVAGKTLTRDVSTPASSGIVISAISFFFKKIILAASKIVARVNFAELGAALMFLVGLIIMVAEVESESFTVFVVSKIVGLAIFSLSILLLRHIDPDNWVNPWEREKKED